ncbi:MAG: hypothetical protein V4451_08860 [Pseudomonadota bacterium]
MSLPFILLFSADSTSVDAGDPVVLTWITEGASEVVLNGIPQHALNGSVTVNLLSDTEFILQASNWQGATNSSPLTISVSELDPSTIPGLKMWWDFSDNATITESSGAVSQVVDKSGNGYDLVQSNPSLQPVIAAGGSGDLQLQSVQITAPNIFEIATQYDTNATGNSLFYVTSQISSGCDPYVLINSGNTQYWTREAVNFIYYDGNGVGDYGSVAPNMGPHQFTSLVNVTDLSASIFKEDGSYLPVTVMGSLTTLSFNKVGYTADNYYAEVLVYDRMLNETEAAIVELYLRSKWGLS